MKLTELFDRGEYVVTGEVGPPKGATAQEVLEGARIMADYVAAVNITDNQSAVMRLGSLAVARLLKDEGIEPVFQLTCRDRNRIALQSDLLSAEVLGVDNVLIITGDHMVLGDHPQAKGVFDLDSVNLLAAARGLNEGHDMAGEELEQPTDLCLGAVVAPGSDNLDLQLIKMRKKIDAGAQFFQTQAVYEADLFKRFMDRAGEFGAPVEAGIVPVKSAGMARYMNANVAGVTVPDWIIEKMNETPKEDRKKVSTEITAQFIRDVRDFCQGAHIMPQGWDDMVPEVVRQAGLAD
jgi:methylenetetrahydrofolate reductase (NADPH)